MLLFIRATKNIKQAFTRSACLKAISYLSITTDVEFYFLQIVKKFPYVPSQKDLTL